MKEKKRDKRIRIIEAAMEVFSGNLFHQVTMEEVAVRAKVGKGTIYLYFENKEDLFRETLKYAMELYFSRLREGIKAAGGPKERLKKILTLQLNFLKEDATVIYLLVEKSMAPPLIFREEMEKSWKRMTSFIRDLIEEGIAAGVFRDMDAELAAHIYLGGLISLTHKVAFQREEESLEHLAEKFADILLEGFNRKFAGEESPRGGLEN